MKPSPLTPFCVAQSPTAPLMSVGRWMPAGALALGCGLLAVAAWDVDVVHAKPPRPPNPQEERPATPDGRGDGGRVSIDVASLDRHLAAGGDVIAGYVRSVALFSDQRTPMVMLAGYPVWLLWPEKRATDEQFRDKDAWVASVVKLHEEMRGQSVVVVVVQDKKSGPRAQSITTIKTEDAVFTRYAVRDRDGEIVTLQPREAQPFNKENPSTSR